MSQPQEIIVYRNPVEYALYNSDLLFPIMVSAGVGIIAVVLVAKVQSYFMGSFMYRRHNATKKGPMIRMFNDIRDHFCRYLSMYAGVTAAVATFMKMT